jgi:hypothetical protein
VRWLAIWIACAACNQSSDTPTPPSRPRVIDPRGPASEPGPPRVIDPRGPASEPGREVPVMPASEVKRGQDACKAYVDKVCACAETTPAMWQPCALARALPDALQVGLDVASSPESTRRDVLQAHDSVRKIAKKCIEETAKLPAAGCP